MFPWKRAKAESVTPSAYQFSFNMLGTGESFTLEKFKGQVIMVVNTASKCGFTSQYAGLEQLYEKYKARGFVIIGVPSNDFGGQEPGTNEEIASFCKLNYGVTFPMTSKLHVKGDDRHPFFGWAYEVLGFGTAPKWNFHKYLINRRGQLVNYFHSTTGPDSSTIKKAIEALLDEGVQGANPVVEQRE